MEKKPLPSDALTEWVPQAELEHFFYCPIFRQWFNMRETYGGTNNRHDGPHGAVS